MLAKYLGAFLSKHSVYQVGAHVHSRECYRERTDPFLDSNHNLYFKSHSNEVFSSNIQQNRHIAP